MPKKTHAKKSQPHDQLRAFKDIARELGCDDSEQVFDRALGKIGRATSASVTTKKKKTKKRS